MTAHEEQKIAEEIARALNDLDAVPLYVSYVRKYPLEFLQHTLMKVLSIPEANIRKSRGAYFTYLVQKNGKPHQYYYSGN